MMSSAQHMSELAKKRGADLAISEATEAIQAECVFENYNAVINLASVIIANARAAKKIHRLMALEGCDIVLDM